MEGHHPIVEMETVAEAVYSSTNDDAASLEATLSNQGKEVSLADLLVCIGGNSSMELMWLRP